jgi:hypothetical protein
VSVNRREKNSCVERQLDRLKVQDLEMKSAVNDGDYSSRDGRTMHRFPDLLQRPSTVLDPSISSGLCFAGRVRSIDLSSSRSLSASVLSDSMSNLIILADAAWGSRPSSGGMVQ